MGRQCAQRSVAPGSRGALQPRQARRTLAKRMIPPAASEGVLSAMLRVCAPAPPHHTLHELLRSGHVAIFADITPRASTPLR